MTIRKKNIVIALAITIFAAQSQATLPPSGEEVKPSKLLYYLTCGMFGQAPRKSKNTRATQDGFIDIKNLDPALTKEFEATYKELVGKTNTEFFYACLRDEKGLSFLFCKVKDHVILNARCFKLDEAQITFFKKSPKKIFFCADGKFTCEKEKSDILFEVQYFDEEQTKKHFDIISADASVADNEKFTHEMEQFRERIIFKANAKIEEKVKEICEKFTGVLGNQELKNSIKKNAEETSQETCKGLINGTENNKELGKKIIASILAKIENPDNPNQSLNLLVQGILTDKNQTLLDTAIRDLESK